jgi:hypothetical protein
MDYDSWLTNPDPERPECDEDEPPDFDERYEEWREEREAL